MPGAASRRASSGKPRSAAAAASASLAQLLGTSLGVAWAFASGLVVYGVLRAAMGLRLSQEDEFAGADLSIHKIGATPDREVSW